MLNTSIRLTVTLILLIYCSENIYCLVCNVCELAHDKKCGNLHYCHYSFNQKSVFTFNFNHVEFNCNVCQLENMLSLICDQTFIFQSRYKGHLLCTARIIDRKLDLHWAELTQGRLDPGADLTSGRVDPLPPEGIVFVMFNSKLTFISDNDRQIKHRKKAQQAFLDSDHPSAVPSHSAVFLHLWLNP